MPKVAAGRDVAHAGKTKGEFAAGKGALLAPSTVMSGRKKTKFCMYHLQGVCRFTSETCAFAHSMEDMSAARQARKVPASGSKRAPAVTAASDKNLARGERQKLGAALPTQRPDCRLDSLGPNHGVATWQQQSTSTWSELKEPMFVETTSSGLCRDLAAMAPARGPGPAMQRDPELYLSDASLTLPYRHLLTGLDKQTPDLGINLSAALMQLSSPASLQGYLQGSANASLGVHYEDLVFADAHGLEPGASGVLTPTFYTIPNPFVGLGEIRATDAHIDGPPGLQPSCALGA
mmetsp:Transcript_130336/g.329116  ORF Transcript_130336/g.329116 Transcript_130336/m.329116 type:complete len:291 (-) Transcript_130336:136-1008(-)